MWFSWDFRGRFRGFSMDFHGMFVGFFRKCTNQWFTSIGVSELDIDLPWKSNPARARFKVGGISWNLMTIHVLIKYWLENQLDDDVQIFAQKKNGFKKTSRFKHSMINKKKLGFFGVAKAVFFTKNAVKFLTQALKTPGTTWFLLPQVASLRKQSPELPGAPGWVGWCWFCPLNMTGKLGPRWVLRTYERGELTPLEVSWLSKKGVFVEFFCAFFIWLGHGMPLPFATFARCCTYVYRLRYLCRYYVYLFPWYPMFL